GRFGDQAKPRAIALSAASVGKLALGAGALLALGAGWALGRRGR
ncbi:MAG TPA: short-chain dehydrogenase, partial [Pseudomonas sp.]|nr:short-chain dehydrogenase [Pseudomonas sp.]